MSRLCTLFLFVSALALPATVAAESDESAAPSDGTESATDISDDIRMLSDRNQIVGVADYGAFRATPYHEQLFDWVASRTGRSDVRKEMTDRLGFDPDKALERVTFGVPSDQLGSTPQDLDAFTAVLSGSFDQKKVLAAIRKERDDDLTTVDRPGQHTVYRLDDVELAFTGDGQMTVVQGNDSYRDAAWKTIAGDAGTAAADIEAYGGFSPVDRSRMLWMIQRSSSSQAPQTEDLVQTAAAIDLQSGLDIQVVTIAENESSAKKTLSQFKSVSQTQGTGMLDMIGATPLVTNLSVTRSGNTVTATTSMTDKQFQTMISAIRQMTDTPQKVGMPGDDSSSPDTSDDQNSDSSKESSDDDSSEEGSDFN